MTGRSVDLFQYNALGNRPRSSQHGMYVSTAEISISDKSLIGAVALAGIHVAAFSSTRRTQLVGNLLLHQCFPLQGG